MSHRWRWALRAASVLAFAGAVLLLTLHPSATYTWPLVGTETANGCFSPYDRLVHPESDNFEVPVLFPSWQYSPANVVPWKQVPHMVAAVSACHGATNGREHDVGALGAAALVLVALSLAPRRRGASTSSRQQLAPSRP